MQGVIEDYKLVLANAEVKNRVATDTLEEYSGLQLADLIIFMVMIQIVVCICQGSR